MANHHHEHVQSATNKSQVAVVMVPFVAQGHLNQLLHLACIISAYDIPVHFVSTATHIRQVTLRVQGWNPISVSNIHFHQFQTPDFTSPPPNPNAPTAFPTQLQPAFNASLHLREPTAELFLELSRTTKRLVIIHDSLMAYVVQDFVSIPNAESYMFRPLSAFYAFWNLWEKMGRPNIPIEPKIVQDLPSLEGSFTKEFYEFAKLQTPHHNLHSGSLYDTSRVVEGKYLELLEREEIGGKTKHWAIGPFNPVEVLSDNSKTNRHKCLEWLDKQESNSVIYISFGTTTSFSDEQIKELAIGLERSEQKFIWVLRDADTGDVFGDEVRRVALPKGYEDRVKGIVVREWAPQLEILAHPATGGFVSHCGWNSSMESITMGVPIATWPMHSDQPRNAFLITRELKIGLVLRDWARRGELVTSAMVEEAVRKLMDLNEGDEMRKRAAELGGAVRRSVMEGGVSRAELDSFVSHISRISSRRRLLDVVLRGKGCISWMISPSAKFVLREDNLPVKRHKYGCDIGV